MVEPRRELIVGRELARHVAADFTRFEIAADDRARRAALQELRLPTRRTVDALLPAERRLLLIPGVIVETRDAQAQFARQQHAIRIERRARTVVAAESPGDLRRILGEVGTGRACIDDAGGTPLAEQNRVRAALEIDAVDIVAVPRNVREEEIAGVVGRRKTAHARVVVRIAEIAGLVEDGAVADAREVAADAADFRVRCVLQQRRIVRGADVLQQLRGDDGHGVADILQPRVEAVARQRGFSGVASVFPFNRYFERRQNEDFRLVFIGAGLLSERRGSEAEGHEQPHGGQHTSSRPLGCSHRGVGLSCPLSSKP